MYLHEKSGVFAKKKLLITATVQEHIWQCFMPLIEKLKKYGFEVHIAGRNNDFNQTFEDFGVDKVFDVPFSRSPKSLDNIKAYKVLKKVIRDNNYDVIHCNTPMGSVITRLAARCARKNGTKVIYTAHGFHFFKGAPFINWLLYYPVEWLLAFKTDVLITINDEDYRLAQKHMYAKKVTYVPGVGIDMEKFSPLNAEERRTKRAELGISDAEIMLLSVGELNRNKNHELIIRAIANFNNPKVHYVIVGKGPLNEYLNNMVKELNIKNQIHFLGFRTDIRDICSATDIFVFPSKREGLPVSVMEAMAVGTPVVCSDIRGNTDLIKSKRCLFDPKDVDSAVSVIKQAIVSANEDIIKQNYKTLQKYNIKNVIEQMTDIYHEIV